MYGQSKDGFHYSKYHGNTPPGDYYGWSFDPSNERATYPEESYGEYNIIKMVGNDDPGYSNLYVDSDTDTYSPFSASVDFGLIAPDGLFYGLNTTTGSFDNAIEVNQRGYYTLAVRNNSSGKIHVSGHVNY